MVLKSVSLLLYKRHDVIILKSIPYGKSGSLCDAEYYLLTDNQEKKRISPRDFKPYAGVEVRTTSEFLQHNICVYIYNAEDFSSPEAELVYFPSAGRGGEHQQHR